MPSFEQNIDTLKELLYDTSSAAGILDILSTDFVLPENEIIKNLLKIKNPALTKDLLSMMVDGISPPGVKRLPSVYEAVGGLTLAATILLPEVNRIKNDVRKSVTCVMGKQQSLMQDLVMTLIQTVTSIAGAAVLIAPVSFNIPAAISVILLIIDLINSLCVKILEIVMCIEPLKDLKVILKPKLFKVATGPINVGLMILIAIVPIICALKLFIDKLMNKLKKNVDNLDQSEVPQEMKDFEIPIPVNGKFDDKEVLRQIGNLREELGYVWDVELPDGKTIVNVDDVGLEELKELYEVVMRETSKLD